MPTPGPPDISAPLFHFLARVSQPPLPEPSLTSYGSFEYTRIDVSAERSKACMRRLRAGVDGSGDGERDRCDSDRSSSALRRLS